MTSVRIELTPPRPNADMSDLHPADFISSKETVSRIKRKTSLQIGSTSARRLKLDPPPLEEHLTMQAYSTYALEKVPWRNKLSVELPMDDFFDEMKVSDVPALVGIVMG